MHLLGIYEAIQCTERERKKEIERKKSFKWISLYQNNDPIRNEKRKARERKKTWNSKCIAKSISIKSKSNWRNKIYCDSWHSRIDADQ